MLHACFYTICLLFRYTSWHFYAFSGTNLLTSCHSASFLFSAVFVFQKWYTGNILGIGRNKFLMSYFSQKLPDIRRRVRDGGPGAHTQGRRGQPLARAAYVWGHLVPPLTTPLRLYIPPDEKNLSTRSDFQNTSRSAAAVDPKIGRVQKLFPAPCRRGESPPEVFFIAMLASGAMSE